MEATHELFSIYVVYDDKLTRPIRCTLAYLKCSIFFVLSAVFYQNYSVSTTICLVNIVGLTFSLLISFIKVLLLNEGLPKLAGIAFVIIGIGVSWISILSFATKEDPEIANAWTIAYLISQLIDSLII